MPTWAQPPLPSLFAAERDGTFVGRRAELELLEAVWAQVEEGRPQTVFVAGAPGSGKSHLAAEVARALHARGVAVLLGACTADLGPGFHPFAEVLDRVLAEAEPGGLAHVIPPDAGSLTRMTTHLDRHTDRSAGEPPPAGGLRRELLDAYASLLSALATERPLALIVEDVHWASAPALVLLGHVIRSVSAARLLVLATLRDTAPDRSPELSSLVADAYRRANVHRIDLGGLTADDIAAFLATEGGVELSQIQQAATLLAAQTGGNPFFLRELWHDLRRRGGFEALRAGELTAPRSVRDALESRMRSFAPAERACLQLAAVIGDGFDTTDVAAAGGYDREQVVKALDHATAYGLLTYDARSGVYEFPHALVRQAVVDDLSPSRSAQLHANLAEAVRARCGSRPESAPMLARLYDGASALGYEDARVHYLSIAASRAQDSLAHEQAAALWERAARVVASDRARADDLLLAAADSRVLAGDFADARRIFREVTAAADPRAALRAAIGYEDASWRPGLAGRDALELVVDALDRARPDATDPLYARALAAQSRAHAFCGEMRTARRVGSQALHMARDLGDGALVAEALSALLLQAMTMPGNVALHHQHAIELREIAVANRDFDKLGPAGAYRALTSYKAGDLEGWDAGVRDLELTAVKTGQPFWEWLVGCHQHCRLLMDGDFAAAGATAERISELGSAFGSDGTDGPYGLQKFVLQRETGRLEQLRPLVAAHEVTDGTWLPGLLALFTELGMDAAARNLLRALLEQLDGHDRAAAVWPAVVVFVAQAAIRLADDDALRVVEPLVAEYDGYNMVVGQCVTVLGSANVLLAQLRALDGDMAGATAHFDAALAMDRRVGSAVHEADTLARYALFLDRRGEPGDARRGAELRHAARALAEPRGHARVLKLLAARGRTSQLPDNLTARELDVLRLLADGASNKQIGRQLHISQNTAANHVRSILTKTGSMNRTQAAIYAADNELLTPAPARTSRRATAGRPLR